MVKIVAPRGSALALALASCAIALSCGKTMREYATGGGAAGEGVAGAGAPSSAGGQGGQAAQPEAGQGNEGGSADAGMAAAGAGASGAPTPTTLSLLAGALGGCGTADGVGADARFCSPSSIAWDGASNVYVAEYDRIRKVAVVNGTVSTTMLASGEHPTAIAVDPSGQTLFAAMQDYTLRKIDITSRHETVLAGEPLVPGTSNGKGALAHFSSVSALVISAAGELFLLDAGNQTIRRVETDGTVSTLAGQPGATTSANGTGAAASFRAPRDFCLQGNTLYVSDGAALRTVDIGSGLVGTLAGSLTEAGSVDAVGGLARFANPSAVAFQDGYGTLFVGDGNAVRRVVVTTGDVTTPVGQAATSEFHDGTGTAAHFVQLGAMVFDGVNSLFAIDNGRVLRKISLSFWEVTTLVGTWGPGAGGGDADGVGGAAWFFQPAGIAADGSGQVFVADSRNDLIRQVDPKTKQVTTLAGYAKADGEKDGTGAAARFSLPLKGDYAAAGVATDADGHVFVADSFGQTIREIVASSGVVTTLAGSAHAQGFDDATGGDARFLFPSGATSDGAGNLFIVDTVGATIRKLVVGSKVVTTLAGSPGMLGSKDGLGAQARFNLSCAPGGISAFAGIVADGAGSLYVADCGNSTIRKVDAESGDVTTLTGSAGVQGDVDGPLDLARFDTPSGIAFAHDLLYVTDPGNGTLRQIALESGQVDTLVGKPSQLGVVLGALPGGLNRPTGVAVLPSGDVVIADAGENSLLLLH